MRLRPNERALNERADEQHIVREYLQRNVYLLTYTNYTYVHRYVCMHVYIVLFGQWVSCIICVKIMITLFFWDFFQVIKGITIYTYSYKFLVATRKLVPSWLLECVENCTLRCILFKYFLCNATHAFNCTRVIWYCLYNYTVNINKQAIIIYFLFKVMEAFWFLKIPLILYYAW